MNIQDAPNMLQYSDPVHWIRNKVLPEKRICSGCDSTLVLDHESDLYVTSNNGRAVLAYMCMVCGQGCIINRPSDKTREEAKAWVDFTDEEYNAFRQKKVVERAKVRREYLNIGSDKWLPGRYQWIEDTSYTQRSDDDWERYIEEKFLPVIPPETRTTFSKLEIYYDDVLKYYQKKVNTVQKVKKGTTSVLSSVSIRVFLFSVSFLVAVVGAAAFSAGSESALVSVVIGCLGCMLVVRS